MGVTFEDFYDLTTSEAANFGKSNIGAVELKINKAQYKQTWIKRTKRFEIPNVDDYCISRENVLGYR